jgi:hypothetical protein
MTEYFAYMKRTFRFGGGGVLSSTCRAEINLIFTGTGAVFDETRRGILTPAS